MDLTRQFASLEADINAFHASDAASEEWAVENRLLKLRLKELLVLASTRADTEMKRQALDLLSKTTGCAQDYAIFQDIADELLDRQLVSADDMAQCLNSSPVSRWL